MIGIFDSGIGGLSVWRALRTALPSRKCLYLADQARAPYGPRPIQEVRAYTLEAVSWLVDRGARTIVLACNTATAAAADAARARWPDAAIIGIEPALKPAAQATRTGTIAVLATQATFDSARYAALVERYAGSSRILQRACPDWVALVEDGATHDAAGRVSRVIDPLLDAGADQLVLGCTHFPLLAPWLEAAIQAWRARSGARHSIVVIDPAPAVARQTARVERSGVTMAEDAFYTTGHPQSFDRAAAAAIGDEWVSHAQATSLSLRK